MLSFTFKKDSRAELYRPHIDDKLVVVSFMTIAELDRWALHHNWGARRRRNLELFLQDFLFSFWENLWNRSLLSTLTGTRSSG